MALQLLSSPSSITFVREPWSHTCPNNPRSRLFFSAYWISKSRKRTVNNTNQSGHIVVLHSGQYCLTEVGHGLDVIHLETTATLLRDGFFDLHTPVQRAAKYVNQGPGPPLSNTLIFRFMPPTSPVSPEFPCISIVFARTIVHEEDHGIKPFFLQLHDGQSITSGVTIKCTMIRLHSLFTQ